MPFCPNGKALHIVQRSENLLRNRWTPSTAPASCLPAGCDSSLFTPVKSADLPQCLASEDKKIVTSTSRFPRNDNLSVTSLNFHHLGLKRHFIDKKCRCPNSSSKMLASKKKTTTEAIFSWNAKVSVVPMK